jgi:two-component system, NarL family, response regulator LiaR
MRRTILIYGASLAILIFVLKFIEYQYLVRDLTLEFYLGVVAVLFTVMGIWMGLRLSRKRITTEETTFVPDDNSIRQLGISKREHDVLTLMAEGLSNQEIADKLFVSLNTVKTHSANLFLKLQVRRRTQAIQKAKQLHLIP